MSGLHKFCHKNVFRARTNAIIGFSGAVLALGISLFPFHTSASDSAVVSVYVDDKQQIVTTDAGTVREVLSRADIPVSGEDIVEPGMNEEITSQIFNINIYRARPVLLVDGDDEYRINSAYTSPRLIAENSEAVKVYDEDRFETELIKEFIREEHIGFKVFIDRATPVEVSMGNQTLEVRTHAGTVSEMLDEQDIEMGENDIVRPALDTPVSEGLAVVITRVGFETVTEAETIDPPIETINDNNRPLGYEKVKEPGVAGVALVTYEVELRNGEEVKRKRIRRVIDEEPQPRVLIIGRQFSMEEAFAQLRFCEAGGDYTTNTGNGFYGAYQFDISTWQSNAPSEYANMLPSEAPASAQDQAALNLYNNRGWQPWPSCGASLP